MFYFLQGDLVIEVLPVLDRPYSKQISCPKTVVVVRHIASWLYVVMVNVSYQDYQKQLDLCTSWYIISSNSKNSSCMMCITNSSEVTWCLSNKLFKSSCRAFKYSKCTQNWTNDTAEKGKISHHLVAFASYPSHAIPGLCRKLTLDQDARWVHSVFHTSAFWDRHRWQVKRK